MEKSALADIRRQASCVRNLTCYVGYMTETESDIRPEQVRAARAWLMIEQQGLAELIGVNPMTIWRFERSARPLSREHMDEIRRIFEDCGLKFTFYEDGSAKGIEARKNDLP